MKNLKGEYLPIEPMAFWQLIKEIVEQVVNESKLQYSGKHTESPLIKV